MSGTTLPTVLTAAGLQPQTPASLNAQLLAQAAILSPGITQNLPGSLIEDLGSTGTGALVVIDQARVDFVNSLTPYGANDFLLTQLGLVYGVPLGVGTNTSVYVVFTSNSPGYVIQPGFIVSDGTYQYILPEGGVITTSGQSQPLFAQATQAGSWAVPIGTVTQIVTSVPTFNTPSGPAFTLSVSNPLAGTPSAAPQTAEAYRAQVLQAGLSPAQGMTTNLKTQLNLVNGVLANLVSVRQQTGGGWEVIVGGTGDPYQIGHAIVRALFDISTLTGSAMLITGVTNANPGVVTTVLNHGLPSGQVINITGALGMTAINNVPLTITVISQTTFSIGLNTTTLGTYTGGGVVTPNFRNITVNIYDYPDTYTVPFVVPPQQTVSMVITWNTSSTGFIAASAVSGAVQPAIAAYVNALPVGQPMNLFELQATFQAAVTSLFSLALLTRMVFAVSINGIGIAPQTGTGIIAGDPESYFSTTQAAIIVNQG